MPTNLTADQKAILKSYLSRPPVSLPSGHNRNDFPRELDVEVYEVVPGSPVCDWDNNPIISGRFFRLTHFANRVLAAMQLGHDRYGMLGEPRTIPAVDPNSLRLTKAEWEGLLSDLRDIVLSIDPDLKFQWDALEFTNHGLVVQG